MEKSIFNPRIDTLCFCGGGMKGIVYYGILKHLESNNHINMDDITTYSGTSVGGIIGFLFCIGYTIQEIIEFILHFNFNIIQTEPNCENIFINYGICSSHKLVTALEHFLKHKYDVTDITFIELYKLTNKKLIIIGTNITDNCEEVFDYINTPNMSVMIALQITSCIPVLFTPIVYNDKYYVDGGVANCFPIKYCNKDTTLGLFVYTNKREIDSLKNVLLSCLAVLLNISYKDHLNHHNIISITNLTINPDDFDLTQDVKQGLIDNGINIAKEFINNYNKKEKEMVSITPSGIELKLNIDI